MRKMVRRVMSPYYFLFHPRPLLTMKVITSKHTKWLSARHAFAIVLPWIFCFQTTKAIEKDYITFSNSSWIDYADNGLQDPFNYQNDEISTKQKGYKTIFAYLTKLVTPYTEDGQNMNTWHTIVPIPSICIFFNIFFQLFKNIYYICYTIYLIWLDCKWFNWVWSWRLHWVLLICIKAINNSMQKYL